MHPAYFETRFVCEAGLNSLPADFAIITAFATTGEKWASDVNDAADQALQDELEALNALGPRITGYSPSSGHSEPGWVALLEFEDACDFGLKYKQDAIYYVRDGVLYVSLCDARRAMIRVDSFQNRTQKPTNQP